MSVSSLLRLLVYGLGGAIIGWFIGFVGGCGYSASLVTEPDPPNFGVIIVALFVALWAGSVGFIIGVYLFARKRSPIGTSKGEDVNVPPNHDHRP